MTLTLEPRQEALWPLALVAEDNVLLRENAIRMLRRRGVAAIPVGSYQQALDAVAMSPHIDVALLDIHLAEDQELEDKGGIEIARLLRAHSATTRLIGYSSKFEEHDLSPDERSLFDETTGKGNLTRERQEQLWEMCASFAQLAAEDHRQAVHEREAQLRRIYEAETPVIEVMRRLQLEQHENDGYTAEGSLGLAGYRLRIVRLNVPERGWTRTFVVWVQRVVEAGEEWVNVEVYNHPSLYASDISEEAALESLGVFLHLTLQDIELHSSGNEVNARTDDFVSELI